MSVETNNYSTGEGAGEILVVRSYVLRSGFRFFKTLAVVFGLLLLNQGLGLAADQPGGITPLRVFGVFASSLGVAAVLVLFGWVWWRMAFLEIDVAARTVAQRQLVFTYSRYSLDQLLDEGLEWHGISEQLRLPKTGLLPPRRTWIFKPGVLTKQRPVTVELPAPFDVLDGYVLVNVRQV